MAKLEIDAASEAFAQKLRAICADRGIHLSEHSDLLLRLSVEAWFLNGPPASRERLEETAQRIVRLAVEEAHVTRLRDQKEKIVFHAWFYALAQSGAKVIRDIVNKGF